MAQVSQNHLVKPIKLTWSISIVYKKKEWLYGRCSMGRCKWCAAAGSVRINSCVRTSVTQLPPRSLPQKCCLGLSSKSVCVFFSPKNSAPSPKHLIPGSACSLLRWYNRFVLEQSCSSGWGQGFEIQLHIDKKAPNASRAITNKTGKILYWLLLSHFSCYRRESKCKRRMVLLHLLWVSKQKKVSAILNTQTPIW